MSLQTYTDNGTNTPNGTHLEFTYTFPVLQTEDVKVALNGVTQATTKYSVSTSPAKITFNNTSVDSSVQAATGAPLTGVQVRVFRETEVYDSNNTKPKASYASGSSIRAQDLNNNQDQALYAIKELQEQQIANAKVQSGAITADKIKDGTVVNAHVNASAAIDGTKISPNFGSQNIVTSGTVDGRDVSTDGTKLDGIESGATADQTASEIKALYEDSGNSNASYIKTQYESNSNTNAYTDAEKTKLTGIATGADVTSSNSINALTDVNTSGVADGKILKYQSSSNSFVIADDGGSGSGGSSTFTGLTDTPANYGSAANKTLKVNSAGNAIEFVTVGGSDVVDDTSPQLGGALDTNSEDIIFNTTGGSQTEKARWSASQDSFNLADGTGIKFGNHTTSGSTSGDVTISYINGQDFFIQGQYNGSGDIVIGHSNSSGTTIPVIKAVRATGTSGGGNAELYFDNVKKFETTNGGVSVTGALIGSSTGAFTGGVSGESLTTNDGNIIINSQFPTVSFVDSNANPDYEIKVNGGVFEINDTTNNQSKFSISSGEVNANAKLNCQAGLDTDGDVQFNSGTTNANILWDVSDKALNFDDTVSARFGTDGDLQILHDGTNSVINDIGSGNLQLRIGGATKAEVVSGGFTVTGTCTATSFSGDGSALTGIAAGATGGGSDEIFWENGTQVTQSYTIAGNANTAKNAMSAGPITINNNVVVTIGTNQNWTIV